MAGLRKPFFLYRRLGPIAIWVGRSDYEHPCRWIGIYLPRIGEIEIFITGRQVKGA